MSAKIRLMMSAILAFFSCASVRAQDEEVLKVDIALVTVNVTVTDVKGRPLSGLKAEDFQVTDEGKPTKLEFFDSQGPASIVLVVDVSSSMKGGKWRSLQAGLKKFLTNARPGNDYTLITFSDHPQIIAHAVTADALWQRVQGLSLGGDTALYDAVLLGLNALEQASKRRKALILFSDGADNQSRAKLQEVQQEALAHRATIYTVGILLHHPCWNFLPEECNGQELLKQLAGASGGLVHFPASDEISEVLEKISDDMSGQYSLSYYPPDKLTGWRSIRVNMMKGTRQNLRYQQRYFIK